MSDYIKREDAENIMLGSCDESALWKLRYLPSADVVEVVRCKDCKYWNGELCKNHSNPLYGLLIGTDSNDYCSEGERKEQEHE